MADRFFSDWESLVSAVDAKATQILQRDVAPVAEDILKKHIKSDIYDAYTPKTNGWVLKVGTTASGKDKYVRTTYQRRNDLIDAVYSRMMGKHTLFITITSSAKVNTPLFGKFKNHEGAFLELLESGNMGLWRGGFPRPAVMNTQNEIDTSHEIKSAIQNGIQREIGICIEI